ncbi:hypothetical protein [Clostridium perfringens]|uniref:hypothetical protein n=1 Tax=Clostridium perfringens TaxID=1502 RepID=UPI00016BD1ED|nr:hypothetical protein [Clostridium perfringens]EDT26098.1 hypothetical protein AC5_0845 [Clostridium perfringens CPE str. F4969]
MEKKKEYEYEYELQAFELGMFGQKMNKLKNIEKVYLSGVVDGAILRVMGEKMHEQSE